jgi:hypothetical protein
MGKSQVWVAITFSSDSSVTYPEGAYIDNILLQKMTGSSLTLSELQTPESDTLVLPGVPMGPVRLRDKHMDSPHK